jgi:hypothetical protein
MNVQDVRLHGLENLVEPRRHRVCRVRVFKAGHDPVIDDLDDWQAVVHAPDQLPVRPGEIVLGRQNGHVAVVLEGSPDFGGIDFRACAMPRQKVMNGVQDARAPFVLHGRPGMITVAILSGAVKSAKHAAYTGATVSSDVNPAGPQSTYQRLLAERRADLAAKERAHAWFGHARLAIAASAGAILIAGGLDALVWILLPLAVFVGVAIAHGQLLNARDRSASAVAFYERGLARIGHTWIGRGRTGEDLKPAEHLYAHDLDIFGRGSIFELLATTRTRAGEETLARWLLAPAEAPIVRARQDAVRELATRIDLRETVAVLGDQLKVGVDTTLLRNWSASPIRLRGVAGPVALAALATTTVSALLYWGSSGLAGGLVLALALTELVVGQFYKPRVVAVIEAVEEPSHDLTLLADLLRTLERERFNSPHLQQLQAAIGTGERRASAEIARLARQVAMLASRRNVLFAPLSVVMLWATQWAFAIERWRAGAGVHIGQWLDVIGEFEALLAIGAFAAEHPDYVFPDLVASAPVLAATALAHPVLPPAAVANDIVLGGDAPHLVVVSGSNMSGKSTFLRTIGVNVVLAAMGAPVRATAFRLSPLGIGASISVHDSLTDGRSRFFAEIVHLKHIVDLTVARGGAMLFLLDEILSGTNSHDRRIGAEAVLTGLVRNGAIGLVTTHDLALGDITARLPSRAANMHFEDQFAQGTLAFDYTLRPGIVQTSNALALMRSIGLEV